MTGFLRVFASIALLLMLTSGVFAASISWGPVFDITSVADLNTTGTFAQGYNLGSGANSMVTVGDIVFTPSQLSFASGTADATFYTVGDPPNGGDTGSADLNLVLDSHAWSGGATDITLSGLSVGTPYELQLIAAADRRNCCMGRTQAASDGVNVSGDMTRMGPGSVIGSFTADADTQSFSIVPGTVVGTDPGLSALTLRAVPEPSTMLLAALAGLFLMGMAKRRNR